MQSMDVDQEAMLVDMVQMQPGELSEKAEGKKLGSYFLPEGTFLHTAASKYGVSPVDNVQGGSMRGLSITMTSLSQLLRIALGHRARQRALTASKVCKDFPMLQPCIAYSFTGFCN